MEFRLGRWEFRIELWRLGVGFDVVLLLRRREGLCYSRSGRRRQFGMCFAVSLRLPTGWGSLGPSGFMVRHRSVRVCPCFGSAPVFFIFMYVVVFYFCVFLFYVSGVCFGLGRLVFYTLCPMWLFALGMYGVCPFWSSSLSRERFARFVTSMLSQCSCVSHELSAESAWLAVVSRLLVGFVRFVRRLVGRVAPFNMFD